MFKSLFRWLKKLVLIAWVLFMLFVGIWLAKDNSELVSLTLFGFGMPKTSLGMLVCLVLLLGVLMGFLTNYLVLKPGIMASKRALKKATREVDSLQKGFQKE